MSNEDMQRKINFSLIIILIANSLGCATVTEKEYYRMIKDIKTDNIDFAFMKIRHYLNENPESVYSKEMKFGIAEYYFEIKAYRDAINELSRYIVDYGSDKNTIFAYILLYKIISEYKDEAQLLGKLKEKFFSKSLFLIFADSKIVYYKSILNNTYKIVEHIDIIEVFRNNEPFLKIAS